MEGITLKDFESHIALKTLSTGKIYYESGKMKDIVEETNNKYKAIVNEYQVNVVLDENQSILYTSCDCHNKRGYCEHQAATFYALKELLSDDFITISSNENTEFDFKEKLNEKVKEELLEIAMDLHNHDIRHNDLSFNGMNTEIQEGFEVIFTAMSYMKKRIQSDIPLDSNIFSEILRDAINHENPIVGIHICLILINMSFDLTADIGQDKFTHQVVHGAIESIYAITEDMELLKHDFSKAFFILFQELKRENYERDFKFGMLFGCIHLCKIESNRIILEEYLQELLDEITNKKEKDEKDNFYLLEIKKIQFSIISLCDDEKKITKFAKENNQYEFFKEVLIEFEINNKNYKYALELIKDYMLESITKKHAFQLQIYTYIIYKATKDKKNIILTLKKLVVEGYYKYYKEYKKCFSKEEWNLGLQELLDEFENNGAVSSSYLQILIKEKLQDKIMDYCELNPTEIFSLYKHLDLSYNNQIRFLFKKVILQLACDASNKTHNKEVCDKIKIFNKVFGKKETIEYIQDIKKHFDEFCSLAFELNKLTRKIIKYS